MQKDKIVRKIDENYKMWNEYIKNTNISYIKWRRNTVNKWKTIGKWIKYRKMEMNIMNKLCINSNNVALSTQNKQYIYKKV